MKEISKLLSVAVLLLLIACSVGKSNGITELKDYNLPKYESVVDQFFENYSTSDLAPGEILYFEKKPTGWHISILDHNLGREEVLNQLFWDANKGRYVKLDFKKSGSNEDQSEAVLHLKNNWFIRNFHLYPYYGYTGWDGDVIQLLEGHENLSDSFLNALSRSYRTSADNLINPNNSGFAAPEVTYDLAMTQNSMTAEQLSNYRAYSNLSTETFKRLVKQNPDFPALIGSIETKLANGYVTSFLDLRMFQNETEALKELENCVYSEALIGLAKNSLTSCTKNAILFTGGDNDTFPLLYVQAKLGFRPDVLIVNLSLLNTPRYINHLRNSILLSDPAPFSISAAQIKGDLRSYVYLDNNDSTSMEVAEALTYILDSNNSVSYYNGIPVYQFPTNNLKISGKKGQLTFTFEDRFIYRSGLMALDIISTNQMERPIYFSNGNTKNDFMGLEAYLSYVGLTIELGANVNEPQNNRDLHIDTAKLYQNLMHNYDFAGLDNIHRQNERILGYYGKLFQQLAEVFLIQGEDEKAQKVLHRWVEVIPANRAYLDYVIPDLIVEFYQAGLPGQATKLADGFIISLPTLLDGNTRKKLNDEQINQFTLQVEQIKLDYK